MTSHWFSGGVCISEFFGSYGFMVFSGLGNLFILHSDAGKQIHIKRCSFCSDQYCIDMAEPANLESFRKQIFLPELGYRI